MARTDQKTILRYKLVKLLSRQSLEDIYGGEAKRGWSKTRAELERYAADNWDEDTAYEIQTIVDFAK